MSTIAAINKAIKQDGNKRVTLVKSGPDSVMLMNRKGRCSSGEYPRTEVKSVPLWTWQARAAVLLT